MKIPTKASIRRAITTLKNANVIKFTEAKTEEDKVEITLSVDSELIFKKLRKKKYETKN